MNETQGACRGRNHIDQGSVFLSSVGLSFLNEEENPSILNCDNEINNS